MSIINDFMLLLGIAQKPEPKHHIEDKKRKGWYEVCTTRTVCAEGKRNVSAKLTMFLAKKEIDRMDYRWGFQETDVFDRNLAFSKPEEAEHMAERLQRMIPVLQEVAARMRAEL